MTKSKKTVGTAAFSLDPDDLDAARECGLLQSTIRVYTNPTSSTLGYAYDRQANVATDEFETQKAIRQRCNAFAISCGFQLAVKHSSVKPSNSGNVKYVCKAVNSQQFFDESTPASSLVCPFFINVFSNGDCWKITAANFCHNHVKHIGSSRRPCVEGAVPFPGKPLHNTTQYMRSIVALVELEMLPAHGGSVQALTGKTISTFMLSKGIVISASAVSRLKNTTDDKLHGDRVESYQKLEAYLSVMAEKNPGSTWAFDKEYDGVAFKRAFFFPSVGMHVARMTKRLLGFDGLHLKGEMHKRGVFLVATPKDYNNQITPTALAIVPAEDFQNWSWFLQKIRDGFVDMPAITILSDRQKDLLSAVATVFPESGHRFYLRHIMDNISRTKTSLSASERGIVCRMAKSDCDKDLRLFTKQLSVTKAAAAEYLSGIDTCHWVKYSYRDQHQLPTYSEITSNLSEQANSWIGNDVRSSKPLDAFSKFFLKLSELLTARRQTAAEWARRNSDRALVPVLADLLRDLSQASTTCSFRACLDGVYSVRYLGQPGCDGLSHPWRLVNLPERDCTCRSWRDEEFPCVHAVCAATADGMPLSDLYDRDRLSVSHFRGTYTQPFRPWPTDIILSVDRSLWIPFVTVPPSERGKRGLKPDPKPKHKRIRAEGSL